MRIDPSINFEHYAAQMSQIEGEHIHTPAYWIDQIAERFKMGNVEHGDTLPWGKTHSLVRFRPGELSIWAGMNGHRKSMILGQIVCNFAKHCGVAIASLEMKPEETVLRMCRQCSGSHDPSESFLCDFMSWIDRRMVIYDALDTVKWNRIIGFVYYCAKELKCSHIVIDSLTKCGIPQGDGAAEKDFIDRLQWAAKTLNCHIHLIAHVRKPQNGGEEYVPSKFDIRGAGELTDLVDNVFILWKDKKKEDLVNQAEISQLNAIDTKYLEKPDQLLIIAKQRHGSYEGKIRLWFHPRSLQFLSQPGRAMEFNFDEQYAA